MKSNHYAAIGMLLTAIALQLATAHGWSEVVSPSFVSATLLAIASTFTALFSEKPR